MSSVDPRNNKQPYSITPQQPVTHPSETNKTSGAADLSQMHQNIPINITQGSDSGELLKDVKILAGIERDQINQIIAQEDVIKEKLNDCKLNIINFYEYLLEPSYFSEHAVKAIHEMFLETGDTFALLNKQLNKIENQTHQVADTVAAKILTSNLSEVRAEGMTLNQLLIERNSKQALIHKQFASIRDFVKHTRLMISKKGDDWCTLIYDMGWFVSKNTQNEKGAYKLLYNLPDSELMKVLKEQREQYENSSFKSRLIVNCPDDKRLAKMFQVSPNAITAFKYILDWKQREMAAWKSPSDQNCREFFGKLTIEEVRELVSLIKQYSDLDNWTMRATLKESNELNGLWTQNLLPLVVYWNKTIKMLMRRRSITSVIAEEIQLAAKITNADEKKEKLEYWTKYRQELEIHLRRNTDPLEQVSYAHLMYTEGLISREHFASWTKELPSLLTPKDKILPIEHLTDDVIQDILSVFEHHKVLEALPHLIKSPHCNAQALIQLQSWNKATWIKLFEDHPSLKDIPEVLTLSTTGHYPVYIGAPYTQPLEDSKYNYLRYWPKDTTDRVDKGLANLLFGDLPTIPLAMGTEAYSHPEETLIDRLRKNIGLIEGEPLFAIENVIQLDDKTVKIETDLTPEESVHQPDQLINVEKLTESVQKADNSIKAEIINYQHKKLLEHLTSTFGKERALEIYHNPNLFPELTAQELELLPKGRIDNIIKTASTFYSNNDKMMQIFSELDKIVGPDVAGAIMGDKELIPPAIYQGKEPISEELEKKVLTAAQEVVEIYKDIEKAKQEVPLEIAIKNKLREVKRGRASSIQVEADIRKMLSSAPDTVQAELKTKVNKELAEIFLRQKLKEDFSQEYKATIRRLKLDAEILTSLDYPQAAQFNMDNKIIAKDALNATYRKKVEEKLSDIEKVVDKDEIPPSIVELRKKLKEEHYGLGFQQIGPSDPAELGKYRLLKTAIANIRKQYMKTKTEWAATLPANFPTANIPLQSKIFDSQYEANQENKLSKQLIDSFKKFKGEIKDPSYPKDKLNEEITAHKSALKLDTDAIADKARKEIESDLEFKFYQTYSPYICKEYHQGYRLDPSTGEVIDDTQSIFLEGVCWAKCRNLIIDSLLHPERPTKDLPTAVATNPKDRYLQATYTVVFTNGKAIIDEKSKRAELKSGQIDDAFLALSRISKEQLAHEGLKDYQEKELLRLTGKTDLVNKFSSQLQYLLSKKNPPSAKGWINISIQMDGGGHAISLRIDPKNREYVLFDPNVGVIDFSKMNLTDEEKQAQVLQCFEDLIHSHYPTTLRLIARQIAKIAEG